MSRESRGSPEVEVEAAIDSFVSLSRNLLQGSSAVTGWLVQWVVIKTTLYFLAVSSGLPVLEILAYAGYPFFYACLGSLATLLGGAFSSIDITQEFQVYVQSLFALSRHAQSLTGPPCASFAWTVYAGQSCIKGRCSWGLDWHQKELQTWLCAVVIYKCLTATFM